MSQRAVDTIAAVMSALPGMKKSGMKKSGMVDLRNAERKKTIPLRHMFIVGMGLMTFQHSVGAACMTARTSMEEIRALGPIRGDLQEAVALFEQCLASIAAHRAFQTTDLEDLLMLAEASQRLARRTATVDDYRDALRRINTLEAVPGISDRYAAEALLLKALWIRDVPASVAAAIPEKPFTVYETKQDKAFVLLEEAISLFEQARAYGRSADARFAQTRVLIAGKNEQKYQEAFAEMKALIHEYRLNKNDVTRAPAAIRSLRSLQNYPGQCPVEGTEGIACLNEADKLLKALSPEARASLPGLGIDLEEGLNWSLAFHQVESVHNEATKKADPELVKTGMKYIKDLLAELDGYGEKELSSRSDLLESRLQAQSIASMIMLLSSERSAGRAVFGLSRHQDTQEQVLGWLEGEKSNFAGLEMQRTAVVALALLGLSGALPEDVLDKSEAVVTSQEQADYLARAERTLKAQRDPNDPTHNGWLKRSGGQIDPAHIILLKYANILFEAARVSVPAIGLPLAPAEKGRVSSALAHRQGYPQALQDTIRTIQAELNDTTSQSGKNLQRSNWIPVLKRSLDTLVKSSSDTLPHATRSRSTHHEAAGGR